MRGRVIAVAVSDAIRTDVGAWVQAGQRNPVDEWCQHSLAMLHEALAAMPSVRLPSRYDRYSTAYPVADGLCARAACRTGRRCSSVTRFWDVQACRKAGVPCIGLLSGGVSRDEPTSAGAADVYPGPAELLGALADSLLGRSGQTA